MELKVARAIGESLGHTHFATKRYLPEARAAIRAMREPSAQMLMDGRKRLMHDMTGAHMGPSAEWTFQAMIDAASPEPEAQ